MIGRIDTDGPGSSTEDGFKTFSYRNYQDYKSGTAHRRDSSSFEFRLPAPLQAEGIDLIA